MLVDKCVTHPCDIRINTTPFSFQGNENGSVVTNNHQLFYHPRFTLSEFLEVNQYDFSHCFPGYLMLVCIDHG